MHDVPKPDAPLGGGGPAPKLAPRPPQEAERQVPLRALSAPLRRLLLDTPRAEWYRIKAVRAGYQETVDLVLIVNALEHLLKVSPDRALRRVMDDLVEEGAFYAAYRDVRDAIRSLREKCITLSRISGTPLKAWTDARGRARRAPIMAPGGVPPRGPGGPGLEGPP